MGRFLSFVSLKSKANGAQFQLSDFVQVACKESVTVAASGSAQDAGYIDVSRGRPGETTKIILEGVWVKARTAAATIAAATFTLRTAAAGAGTELTTATAMTGMTAAGKIKAITVPTQTDAITLTDGKLYIRQTVDGANAGVADFYVKFLYVTDRD